MAHITINFRSSVLAMPVMLDVLLPENAGNCKTLYLLHGYGGGRESILLKSRIVELVEGRHIAVIMPSGNNKLFINNKNGKAYHTFVTEELPGRVEKWFSVSPKASDRFLAGVDTGAFGAVYAGLYKPELYHTVFGFQPVLFAEGLRQILSMRDIETVFGTQEEFEACALDLENRLTEAVKQKGISVRLMKDDIDVCLKETIDFIESEGSTSWQ